MLAVCATLVLHGNKRAWLLIKLLLEYYIPECILILGVLVVFFLFLQTFETRLFVQSFKCYAVSSICHEYGISEL